MAALTVGAHINLQFREPRSLPSEFRSRCRPDKLARPTLVPVTCSANARDSQVAQGSPTRESSVLDLKLESDFVPSSGSEPGSSSSDGEAKSAGSIKDVVAAAMKSVEQAPVESVATGALYSGLAVMGTIIGSSLLRSMDRLPVVPEAMQLVGVLYAGFVASNLILGRRVDFAPGPVESLITFVEATSPKEKARASASATKEEMRPETARKLQALTQQRDAAVAQAEGFRTATLKMGRVVAEKEALEAVARQLAEERDAAVVEVSSLKSAVYAMTERMRSLESMLSREVAQLQQQNGALEAVAAQLAEERNVAVKQWEDLRRVTAQREEEEKKMYEVLAAQLITERNEAMAETEELKQAMASLSQASGSSSGLTPEMETFIKSRARGLRANFVDISRPYEEQPDAASAFVAHLVEEFGAPKEWTSKYIRQFLASSSGKNTSLGVDAASLKLQQKAEAKRLTGA